MGQTAWKEYAGGFERNCDSFRSCVGAYNYAFYQVCGMRNNGVRRADSRRRGRVGWRGAFGSAENLFIAHSRILSWDGERSPSYFTVSVIHGNPAKNSDLSKIFLNRVFDMYSPKRRWFGHYHDHQQGEYEGCAWTVLDRCGNPRGGKWIEEALLCSA